MFSKNKKVRQPGIEPGSIAWKATMLTFTPPTQWALHGIRKLEPSFFDLYLFDFRSFNFFKIVCVSRESNPDLLLGRQQC